MLKLYVKENIFMELIRLENVKKIYQTGEVITKAVDGIDFTVSRIPNGRVFTIIWFCLLMC